MKGKILDNANKFEAEMIKEAGQIKPEMQQHIREERFKDAHKSEDTWVNLKSSVTSTADNIKDKTENAIDDAGSKLDRMARRKETKVESDLWQKKVELDLLDDE